MIARPKQADHADRNRDPEYLAETERIKANRERPENQQPHDFKPAEWTHPNGHPRCLRCGDEEPVGGRCAGYEPDRHRPMIEKGLETKRRRHIRHANRVAREHNPRIEAFGKRLGIAVSDILLPVRKVAAVPVALIDAIRRAEEQAATEQAAPMPAAGVAQPPPPACIGITCNARQPLLDPSPEVFNDATISALVHEELEPDGDPFPVPEKLAAALRDKAAGRDEAIAGALLGAGLGGVAGLGRDWLVGGGHPWRSALVGSGLGGFYGGVLGAGMPGARADAPGGDVPPPASPSSAPSVPPPTSDPTGDPVTAPVLPPAGDPAAAPVLPPPGSSAPVETPIPAKTPTKADPEARSSLGENIERWYSKVPGGLKGAIGLAIKHREKLPGIPSLGFTAEDIAAPIPLVGLDPKVRGAAGGLTQAQTVIDHGPDGRPRIRVEINPSNPEYQPLLEHELSHAAMGLRPELRGHAHLPYTTSSFEEYTKSMAELIPRLADINRQSAWYRGRVVTTPEEAAAALNWWGRQMQDPAFRARVGLSHQQSWDIWSKEKDKAFWERLMRLMPQLVGRGGIDTSKVAAAAPYSAAMLTAIMPGRRPAIPVGVPPGAAPPEIAPDLAQDEADQLALLLPQLRARRQLLARRRMARRTPALHVMPAPELKHAAADFAPGLPRKRDYGDLSQLTPGQMLTYVRQLHLAHRAGRHEDLRFGSPEMGLHSWAVPKGLPVPGEKHLAVHQPVHRHKYRKFEGEIPRGQYGGGTVKKLDEGQVLITKATPDAIHFSLAHTRHPERFVLARPRGFGKPTNWLLMNVTPNQRVPYDKLRYKSVPADQVEDAIRKMGPGGSTEAKVDGASQLTQLLKGHAELTSYRTSKTTGRPIVNTEKVFGGAGPEIKVPPHLEGSILKGELYASPGPGKALGPQDIGTLLNSSIAHSRQLQRDRGVKIRQMVYDIQQHGRTPIDPRTTPRPERRRMLEEILPHLPQDTFHLSEPAHGPEAGIKLWQDIQGGRYPMTQEGAVLHPPTGLPMKGKLTEEHDVHLTGTFPGQGKRAPTIGGFLYGHEPGKTVGKVGTGFSDAFLREVARDPKAYIGRVARLKAQEKYGPSGALRAPVFLSLHEDTNKIAEAPDGRITGIQVRGLQVSRPDGDLPPGGPQSESGRSATPTHGEDNDEPHRGRRTPQGVERSHPGDPLPALRGPAGTQRAHDRDVLHAAGTTRRLGFLQPPHVPVLREVRVDPVRGGDPPARVKEAHDGRHAAGSPPDRDRGRDGGGWAPDAGGVLRRAALYGGDGYPTAAGGRPGDGRAPDGDLGQIPRGLKEAQDAASRRGDPFPAAAFKAAGLLPMGPASPQQKRVADRVNAYDPRLLVYHGLGSGKTRTALMAAEKAKEPYAAIVPAALRPNLAKERHKWTDEKTPADILSYTAVGQGRTPAVPPKTLILDESQRLRNPASAATRGVMDLADQAKRVLMLSGTPIVNRPSDLAVPLSILTREPIGPQEFDRRFVGRQRVSPGFMGWLQGVKPVEVPHIQHEQELEDLLRGHVDYHPPKNPEGVTTDEERIEVDMSPQQKDFYRLMWNKLPWLTRWKMKHDYPMTNQELTNLQRFMAGPRQAALSLYPFQGQQDPHRAFQESAKLQAAFGNMEKTLASDPRAKVLAYSNFIEAGLTPYAAALKARGIPYSILHGKLNDAERKAQLDAYNSGKSRVLLLGPSASEGISATGTQLIQLLDPHWNEARLGQATGRGLRFDSHEGLPESLRNVKIQRYIARMPDPGFFGRIFGDGRRPSSDEFLEGMSRHKEDLNNQFRDVLRRVGSEPPTKPWWSLFS